MKNPLLLFALLSSLFLAPNIFATHYMGGEITWECIPAGQADAGKYIFQMKLYRECYYGSGAAAQFPSTATLSSNSPAGSIAMTEITGWPKDISPVCNSNPNFSHITCVGMLNSAPNLGACQEHIYRSQPVKLNGIPPATGWMFYWGSCCRNNATNITGQPSFRIRAIIYPYGTQNAYPCFDNSPSFAEPPQTIFCAGYTSSFNYYSKDNEYDSLSYEWGEPLLSTGAPLSPYSAGYTYNTPLPDASINSNNIAGKVNPYTGWVTFKSFTTGAFVTSVKVSSFKKGTKVSEQWRDLQVVISNCGQNNNPIISITDMQGSPIIDTLFVSAKDTVRFNVSASSTQLLPNGAKKVIDIKAYSVQFGAFIPSSYGNPPTLSSQVGCLNPPCATLIPAIGPGAPLRDSINVQTQFQWVTDCDHQYTSVSSNIYKSSYRFTFIAKDDFCPVPARIAKSIVVKIVQEKPPGIEINNVHYNYTLMTADLSWRKNPRKDTGFIAYDIFHSNTYNGPYTLIDSIKNKNQIVYSHNIGSAMEAHYFIRMRTIVCYSRGVSNNSDTLSLNITALKPEMKTMEFDVAQNKPNPSNNSTIISYTVNRAAKGRFQLVDISGRSLKEENLEAYSGENEIELDTSTLPSGIYYYSISFDNIRKVKKLIIMR